MLPNRRNDRDADRTGEPSEGDGKIDKRATLASEKARTEASSQLDGGGVTPHPPHPQEKPVPEPDLIIGSGETNLGGVT